MAKAVVVMMVGLKADKLVAAMAAVMVVLMVDYLVEYLADQKVSRKDE